MDGNKLVLILNDSGFPLKFSAPGNKYFLMAKSLRNKNYKTILLNRYNTVKDIDSDSGKYEGIEYRFLSGSKRLVNFFSKINGYIVSNINLLKTLYRNQDFNEKHLLISYNTITTLIYYRIITKYFGYKLSLNVMEYSSAIEKNLRGKIKAKLLEKYAFNFLDGVIPISNYLCEEIRKQNSQINIFKLPVLGDFSKANSINKISNIENQRIYFLYCGNIGYRTVIDLVIQSFKKLESTEIELKLVVSGNKKDKESLFSNLSNCQNIKTYTNLPYNDLFNLYSNAIALLVPLRENNLQDKARFPQKIAEYLSSKSPVITNNVGEIRDYFDNGVNVILSESFSVESYSKAMSFVIDHPTIAKNIGLRGYELGLKEFDYKSISDNFADYLSSL